MTPQDQTQNAQRRPLKMPMNGRIKKPLTRAILRERILKMVKEHTRKEPYQSNVADRIMLDIDDYVSRQIEYDRNKRDD